MHGEELVTPRTPPVVRLAQHDEWKSLGALLGDAFFDDPVWDWVVTNPERRRKHLGTFLGHVIHSKVRSGTVWTTTEREGAAVWAAPGDWKVHPVKMLPALPSAVRCVGVRDLHARLGALAKMEEGHPTEPHWYLELLAAHYDLRGKGVGTALISPMLERCDSEGLPTYLESSKAENLPFYHRFGFEITEEVSIARGCSPIWRMWREPR